MKPTEKGESQMRLGWIQKGPGGSQRRWKIRGSWKKLCRRKRMTKNIEHIFMMNTFSCGGRKGMIKNIEHIFIMNTFSCGGRKRMIKNIEHIFIMDTFSLGH